MGVHIKRFKGYSVASTVASYVAVVEAGPYLTSVDIRPNTLCKGGSIKTTLYDPCFRSTTVVQGFPAVNSFYTESPEILYQSLFLDV